VTQTSIGESICKFEYRNGLYWVVPSYNPEHVTKQMDQKCVWKVVRYYKDPQHPTPGNSVASPDPGHHDPRRRHLQDGPHHDQSARAGHRRQGLHEQRRHRRAQREAERAQRQNRDQEHLRDPLPHLLPHRRHGRRPALQPLQVLRLHGVHPLQLPQRVAQEQARLQRDHPLLLLPPAQPRVRALQDAAPRYSPLSQKGSSTEESPTASSTSPSTTRPT